MSDSINILQRAENVEISPLFNTYSKVIINIDDETQASSGTDTGRTLELDNPLFGSQLVATKLLQRLHGFQYQPYSAQGALVDPAAEMGDAISVNDVYGGIYTRERTFGRLMITDVSAPNDEEINHEYKWETPTERKLKREMEDVRATFAIQSDRIEARVAKTGGNNSSFGWVLNDTSHTWYSGSRQVMKVSASGLEVTGKITATSGYIGNGSQGFEISARSLANGMTSLNDTLHNGIYIGVDGIALGKGKFKVDSSGNITASGIKLQGTLTFLNDNGTVAGTMSAADLRQGAYRANSGYSTWNNTSSTVSNNSSNWTTGANNGTSAKNTWDNAQNTGKGVQTLYATNLYCSTFHFGGSSVSKKYLYDSEGNVCVDAGGNPVLALCVGGW